MSDEFAVSVQNVSKRYLLYDRPQDRLKQSLFWRFGKSYAREFWALRDVSFEVKPGEALGIIGQNGSGKSTLLQIIAGTLQPTEGTADVRGKVAALLELGAGFNPDFTGRENVFLNGAILGIPAVEMRERFDEIAAFAQIGDFIDQPVKTYSSGMYVRLAFAVAVCVDPDVLIIDEALSVGDALYQSRSFRRMEQMRDSGKTIVLVSHDFYMVQSFCQRALLLDGGRVVKVGEAKPVVNKYLELIATREREYVEWLAAQSKNMMSSPLHDADLASPQITATDQASSEQEFRYGTNEAEIIDCHLLDETGRPTRVWTTGEIGTVVVVTKFHKTVNRPIIAFLVNTPTGVNVFGTNSWYANKEPINQEPGDILKTEFRQLIRLNPGDYILNCGVSEKTDDRIVPLDRRYDTFSFKVTGLQRASGLVDMDSTISHTQVTFHSASIHLDPRHN
jgi:lipopolysaccharide transport system ATP-binding protein